ncbi:DUF6923 family protein, partial [Belliella kenyensis]
MFLSIKAAFTFFVLLLPFSLLAQTSAPSVCGFDPAFGCSNTDFNNSGIRSTNNAATIEYDNFVSAFHNSVVRQADGSFLIWGEGAAANGTGHLLTPTVINASNFPGLTGTPLKVGIGSFGASSSSQFILLTTAGLFAWGNQGAVIASDLTTSNAFQKLTIGGNSTGLPSGINPQDVKMMFVTTNNIGLVTCDGRAFMLSRFSEMRGNGGSGSTTVWSQVTTNQSGNPTLSNVVALRGSEEAMMALRSDGTVWTWGRETYLGNNTSKTSRTRATQMTLPSGVVPKMIGSNTVRRNGNDSNGRNGTSYFLLGTNGRVYSLGENGERQLGDHSTTDRRSWVQPRLGSASGPTFEDVKWISPNEHDRLYGNMSILLGTGEIYTWGNDNGGMLGRETGNGEDFFNPGKPAGSPVESYLTLELGGHTLMAINTCEKNYAYVGHRINGSMGDGNSNEVYHGSFTYETAEVQLCGAEIGVTIVSTDLEGTTFAASGNYCAQGSEILLSGTPPGGTYSVASGPGQLSGASNNILTFTGSGTVVVNYNIAPNSCAREVEVTKAFVVENCQIVAEDDEYEPISSPVGGVVGNILDNDKLGDDPATLSNVTISVITAATPIGGGSVPVLNINTGQVTIPANTPPGTYTIRYQICETAITSNCDQADITITVETTADPFDCADEVMYQTVGSPSALFAVDVRTGNRTQLSSAAQLGSSTLNALGYNVVDNYLYAYISGTNSIKRIFSNGSFANIPIAGLPVAAYNAGDVGPNGIMYLYVSNSTTIQRIDLNTMTLLTPITLSTGANLLDISISNDNQFIYGISNGNGALVTYPITGGAFTTRAIGLSAGLPTSIGMDATGDLFVIGDNTSTVFELAGPSLANSTQLTQISPTLNTALSNTDGAICRNAFATTSEPIGCNDYEFFISTSDAFLVANDCNATTDGKSTLRIFNTLTQTETVSGQLIQNFGLKTHINNLGFNVTDNYLWAYRVGTNQMVRIGSNNTVDFFAIPGLSNNCIFPSSGIDNTVFFAGDMDSNGIMYLANGVRGTVLVRVDLNPNSPTYLTRLSDVPLSISPGAGTLSWFADFAISPNDQQIYFVSSSKNLIRINPTSGVVTNVGPVSGLDSESLANTTGFQIVMFSSDGDMYMHNTGSGNSYRIAEPHSGDLIAESVPLTSYVGSGGDGASCPTATLLPCDPPSAAVTVTQPTCILTTGTIEFTAQSGYEYSVNGGSTYQASPIFAGLAPGEYNLIVREISNVACFTEGDNPIVINPIPDNPETPTVGVDCSLGFGNAVLTVTTPLGTNFEYSLDGGTYQASATFSGVANGSHTVRARNTTTGCESTVANVNVNCDCVDFPGVSLSSTAGSTCVTEPITVSGNIFGGSATAVSLSHNGAGTLSPISSDVSPFSFTYTPAPGDAGNNVLIIVETNNPLGSPCQAAEAAYVLTVNAQPSAPTVASTIQPTCEVSTGTIVFETQTGVEYSIDNGATY